MRRGKVPFSIRDKDEYINRQKDSQGRHKNLHTNWSKAGIKVRIQLMNSGGVRKKIAGSSTTVQPYTSVNCAPVTANFCAGKTRFQGMCISTQQILLPHIHSTSITIVSRSPASALFPTNKESSRTYEMKPCVNTLDQRLAEASASDIGDHLCGHAANSRFLAQIPLIPLCATINTTKPNSHPFGVISVLSK